MHAYLETYLRDTRRHDEHPALSQYQYTCLPSRHRAFSTLLRVDNTLYSSILAQQTRGCWLRALRVLRVCACGVRRV